MRLIHTETLALKEFFDAYTPKYVILSHCWGNEELSFQDFTAGEGANTLGFQKISKCCQLARGMTIEWAWVDTCCIDKKSSAEVSEAINSMFNWYKQAELCIAFLPEYSSELGFQESSATEDQIPLITKSRWFTRGWTLQELLAPKVLIFYDQHFQMLGTKSEFSAMIALDTGILPAAVAEPDGIKTASVAQIMSWAADRQTSRVEDMAYCLIGLLDVNMSLLYGEGRKAFVRLQEEVLLQHEDDSILAWRSDISDTYGRLGLLAPWLDRFRGCNNIYKAGPMDRSRHAGTYRLSHIKGVRCLELYTSPNEWPLLTDINPSLRSHHWIPLDCEYRFPGSSPIGIKLYIMRSASGQQFFRDRVSQSYEEQINLKQALPKSWRSWLDFKEYRSCVTLRMGLYGTVNPEFHREMRLVSYESSTWHAVFFRGVMRIVLGVSIVSIYWRLEQNTVVSNAPPFFLALKILLSAIFWNWAGDMLLFLYILNATGLLMTGWVPDHWTALCSVFVLMILWERRRAN